MAPRLIGVLLPLLTDASNGRYDDMVEIASVRLSSRQTFFVKFLFPSVWLLGFSAGTLALLKSRADSGTAFFFLALTMIGALVFEKVCFPLKNVSATPRGIIVSNFVRQIEVPYEHIASVHENKWLNTRDITIRLNVLSPFGQEIRFQPYSEFTFRFWRDHPAAVLLRERAVAAGRIEPPT